MHTPNISSDYKPPEIFDGNQFETPKGDNMNILESLKGKKTYLAAAGLALAQVSAVLTGEQGIMDVLNWLFMGGGLAALRAAK